MGIKVPCTISRVCIRDEWGVRQKRREEDKYILTSNQTIKEALSSDHSFQQFSHKIIQYVHLLYVMNLIYL